MSVTPRMVAALREAAASGRLNGSTKFALDLCQAFERGRLSVNQAPWVQKLLDRVATPATTTTARPAETLTGDVASIFGLFANAKSRGLKWPKVRLTTPAGQSVAFGMAGPASKYAGEVMVTDGGSFGNNRYFGRISPNGLLHTGRDMTDDVRALLVAFAADPAGQAAQYGKATGHCCFCNLTLTTPESLTAGYGPICADKFGLEWGAIERVVAPAKAAPAATAEAVEAEMHQLEAEGERLSEVVGFTSDPDQRSLGGEAAYQQARRENEAFLQATTDRLQ